MELTDRNLLALLDTYKGAGVVIDGKEYRKESGETPFHFINRVRDIHNAWRNSKTIEASRAPRDIEISSGGKDSGNPGSSVVGNGKTLQKTERSLEETVEAQVTDLRNRVEQLRAEKAAAEKVAATASRKIDFYTMEIEIAEKFLEELRSASKVRNETSEHIPTEARDGGEVPGDRVGGQDSTEGEHQGDSGRDISS